MHDVRHTDGVVAVGANPNTKKTMSNTATATLTAHPAFHGILEGDDFTPYFATSSKGAVRAYNVEIFGALPIPTGVTILAEDLYIRLAVGGNNESRRARLSKGTVVGYYPTSGGEQANRLFASEFAS